MSDSSATKDPASQADVTAGERRDRLQVLKIYRPGYGDLKMKEQGCVLELVFNRRPSSEEMDDIYSVVGGWLSQNGDESK